MYGTGEYTMADLAGVFAVSRTTVYRTVLRSKSGRDTLMLRADHQRRSLLRHIRPIIPEFYGYPDLALPLARAASGFMPGCPAKPRRDDVRPRQPVSNKAPVRRHRTGRG